ncbi:hypothetical protein GCM10023189_56490 [Nibrella saemangeumensis]|uniref:Uncharacterized protein n=1 Tax=Nibrella saemangeumensis TaxID=1084526 RepID=A0ABP8NMR2_9BACT
MSDIVQWLKEYSPVVVLLLALGAGLVFILQQTVEKAIGVKMDTYARHLELKLERRSAFMEKLLTDRFIRIADLSTRLEKVMTNINQLKHNHPVPKDFMLNGEIIPLTEIYEDITIHRLILTETFYGLLRKKADLALQAANTNSVEDWGTVTANRMQLDEELRLAVEETFRISEIKA